MQASNTAYGRVMTVSVSGQALDQGGLAMTVDNVCTNVTKLAGGASSTRPLPVAWAALANSTCA